MLDLISTCLENNHCQFAVPGNYLGVFGCIVWRSRTIETQELKKLSKDIEKLSKKVGKAGYDKVKL